MRIRFFALAALALLLGACTQDGKLPAGRGGRYIHRSSPPRAEPRPTATAGTRSTRGRRLGKVCRAWQSLMDGTVKAYDVTPSTADPTSATLTSTDPYSLGKSRQRHHRHSVVTYTAGETTPPAVR